MTKRVAWFTGEPSVKGCFTPYKVYEVVLEGATNFNVINDKGGQNNCLKKGCAHICHGDWVFADVVEEEPIKRKGVMTLLPEDSEFKIGQRVRVDRSGYIGYTTIIGYNYYNDEYATECDEDNGCSHDCEGLAKVEGKGLWVSESDIIESVEAKQPKWSEWIENTTGKCPEGLKRGQKIKLKWSDGDEFNITDSQDAAWYIDKGDGAVNITHYKVKLKDIAKDAPANDSKDKQNTDWQDNVLGLCPVPPNKVVEAKLQCGEILKWEARDLNWGDTLSADRKIIKWRLV